MSSPSPMPRRILLLMAAASLAACATTPDAPIGAGAVSALHRAEEHLRLGRPKSALLDAEQALLRAPDEPNRVRALLLRARARLALGLVGQARVDAASAASLVESAFRHDAAARHTWHREAKAVLGEIDDSRRRSEIRAPEVPADAFAEPSWKALVRAAPPAAEIAVERRSRWNARAIRSNKDPMAPITRITVHHTGVPFDGTDYGATAAGIRSIQRQHQDGNGWADIGYHFIVDRAGRVWEGRSLEWQGAHAGNPSLNRGNIGVAVLGHFDRQHLTPAQREALVRLLDDLRSRYGIQRSQVLAHGELKATACPGSALRHLVDDYKSRSLALAAR